MFFKFVHHGLPTEIWAGLYFSSSFLSEDGGYQMAQLATYVKFEEGRLFSVP